MRVFLDTSALLAILNAGDRFHQPAKQVWEEVLSTETTLITSNYILLETIALLQHRFGMEAVRLFENELSVIIDVAWVDEATHRQGMSALLAANRRQLSLVDCTSFEIIRQGGVDKVFTFDPHFHEQGFDIIPAG